jgi:hypothetical protein
MVANSYESCKRMTTVANGADGFLEVQEAPGGCQRQRMPMVAYGYQWLPTVIRVANGWQRMPTVPTDANERQRLPTDGKCVNYCQ